MQREFLQEKSLNRSLDNAEKSLNVDLSAKSKLIPYSMVASMLGLNDLYIEERDACENYRMIFTINPICTNVLYNAITEPVYREGSLSAVCLSYDEVFKEEGADGIKRTGDLFSSIFPDGTLNQSGDVIDQIFAVRDTELSHEKIGDFKYHCGYDIFNNHLLRTDDFEHVKMETNNENEDVFNTIFDFAIDYSGKTVTRVLGESDGPLMVRPENARERVRMYQLDNIKTMNKAFFDELRTVDGWFGFYNKGYINIPNAELAGEEVSLNRILNNEIPCGFIDLYPDRSLYSFIPKVNRYKKRLERNWDCGIAYPYKSDTDMFNRIMLNFSGTTDEWENPETGDGWKKDNPTKIPNAVRILEARVTYNNVGDEIIEMHSLLRHTLQPGDEIRVFYTISDYTEEKYEEIFRYSPPVRVITIGDVDGNNTDRVFCVKQYDFNVFCGVLEEEITNPNGTIKKTRRLVLRKPDGTLGDETVQFFYRKIEGGCDDKYYFRKFKVFKNFDYVQVLNCQKIEDNPAIETKCTEEEWEEYNEAVENAVKLIKKPTVINDGNPKYIRIGNDYFKKVVRPLTYTQNKIAFAENIFGDRVAQVIFNDDISITGLKDNLGRPLSVLYFIAVKTNRGYKEWYNSGITSADTIEYSHCFGDVTSGLDLPEDSGATDYNVRKLYNVFSGECQDQENYLEGLMLAMEDAPVGNFIDGTPIPIESGITLDDFDEFYGDIIEFSKANFSETTIEKVYHRFNTAQRECLLNKKYYDIFYDELTGDLFDVNQGTDYTK